MFLDLDYLIDSCLIFFSNHTKFDSIGLVHKIIFSVADIIIDMKMIGIFSTRMIHATNCYNINSVWKMIHETNVYYFLWMMKGKFHTFEFKITEPMWVLNKIESENWNQMKQTYWKRMEFNSNNNLKDK